MAKNKEDRKTSWVSFRLEEAKKKKLMAAAKNHGMSVSEYITSVLGL